MAERNLGVLYPVMRLAKWLKPELERDLYQVLEPIDGWLWPRQALILFCLSLMNDGKFFEVGSWKGKSTLAFLLGNHLSTIDCIDTFKGTDGDAGHTEKLSGSGGSSLTDFKNNIAKFNFTDRVIIHEGYSLEMASKFPMMEFNLGFIDAAHDYDNVKADIIAWRNTLKRGAVICGHDYPNREVGDQGFDGLLQAVNEEVRDNHAEFYDFGHLQGIWAARKV